MKHLDEHILQSTEWGEFKTIFGTSSHRIGNLQLTKHKIPFLPFYVGYAPRVNFDKQKFSWKELKEIASQEKIAFIRFDVPNMTVEETSKGVGARIFQEIKENCKKSPRSTFARWNVIMDISKSEQEIVSAFSQKTRYNIKLASKKGVYTKIENDEKGFNTFYKLLKETSKRHNFLIHPENYYKKILELFSQHSMVNIINAYYEDTPLASWMVLNYRKTMYYPYGASSEAHKNLMASNLVAWEAIRLAKSLNCETFDMWGATNDRNNPWWGFTRFKLGYGGELVQYIDSYDFVINKPIYIIFNFAYNSFWKVISVLRNLRKK